MSCSHSTAMRLGRRPRCAFGLDAAFSTQAFVAVAEDNLDPCDLRIKRGNEAVRALIANARPLYDFVIDSAIDRFDTTYATGQMGAVKAVALADRANPRPFAARPVLTQGGASHRRRCGHHATRSGVPASQTERA